ncbi:hypothetical protein LEMA_P094290.1 [Plenodomus lingam JN3]|uniref:RING-type E3 ubiquitin transferase n=2 Tax=Leptosphaeria maculans TaxID=5022 RepID=E5A307_LEPMJ|nr:hypothetical protein LEMA_P094290.1 [Plenodomus lingam JN3]CBX98020.1 hypothetical protein LEMA_P094290.1 [Plenodomus lingam JN3]
MANVVLMRAYYERPNFYSAAVYISQSTGSLMFLVNLMLIVAASFGYGLQRLFYGPLRPIETEQLYDKAWFAVSETLLAMTIFRDDIGMWFFAMFLCLLAGKVWQWIGEGRVEFLEQQPPANPKLFHTRLMSSLLFSVVFDIYMMQYCIDSILSEARPGVKVMFGFEYVLLAIASISTLLRYALSLVELYVTHRQEKAREEARQAARALARQSAETSGAEAPVAEEEDEDEGDVPGWEEKGRWVFYLDLATDFIKSVVYLGFFMILMTFYGIPIHIMRDLFMTIRSLLKRIKDFVQYRNATRDMNTRYPDATAEELERENTCIVCREEMKPWVHPGADGAATARRMDERQRPKKLPCGHILHFSCLRSWLERQQVCPTCRRPVLSQTTAQATQGNNAANPGAPNPPNQQVQQRQGVLPGFLGGNPLGGGGQPGQQPLPQQQGQANAAAGNMRVFNLGPIRVALGNLRLPPGQQNNADNVRQAMDQIRQQAIADRVARNVSPQNQGSANAALTLQNPPQAQVTGPLPGATALHPSDIQSDILRIQQNIMESMRQLHVQQEELEVIHGLLGELNRLQQTSGVSGVAGNELPAIAPLHPPTMSSFTPQAYLARGEALRQGDAGVPDGLSLPEGWTLRRMVLATRSEPEGSSPTSSAHQTRAAAGSAFGPRPATSEAEVEAPVAVATNSGSAADSSPPRVESDSLGSSWSFGNAEGSSSAVATAGSTSDGQNVTKRAVTIEDAEDNGQ